MFQPLNATFLYEEGYSEDLPAAPSDGWDEEEITTKYSRALQLLSEGEHQNAEVELEKMSKFLSKTASRKEHKLKVAVLMNLAECYSFQDKYDAAVVALSEACSLNSKNSTAWFKLGCLMIKTRSAYDAIPAFREALSNCSGTHWMALVKLCQCLFIIGLFDDCIDYCLKGLAENSSFTAGHTLLLEIMKEEKNIVRYNRSLRENVDILDESLYDRKIISDCEIIRKQHASYSVVSHRETEFTPKTKLASKQKMTLAEICRFLTVACEEAISTSNALIDCILKVGKSEPVREDAPPSSTTNVTLRQPVTPQQPTRASRLTSQALAKPGMQTPGTALMKTKLLRYVGQLKGLCDPGEQDRIIARRSSISQTGAIVDDSSQKLSDFDTSDDLQLFDEDKLTLRQFVKHFLDRMTEQAKFKTWERDDAIAFCLLFQQFKRFTDLRPFCSLDDLWEISVCDIVRVYLETVVDFLAPANGEGQHQYLANFISPPVALDLTDEIDCVTLPSLLCPSSRFVGTVEERQRNKIRHCLLFFRLSKMTHNFNLMQQSSSCCHSVLSDFPDFGSIFLGHVFRHPIWRRDEILMEMKWTNSYELLRSQAALFDEKNWEGICSLFHGTPESIFDVSNFDLILASDLAHYSVTYAEALLRCSKEGASDFLLQLLSSLSEALVSGKPAPMLKKLLTDSWQLCFNFFDAISANNRSTFIKQMISSLEIVFNWVESNTVLPFNCSGLICSLYAAFPLLADIGNKSNLPIKLDFSLMDDEFKPKSDAELDDLSNDSFDSDEDSDFAKLPVAVKFLILFHDVLTTSGGGLCRCENGMYLELIRDRLIDFMRSPAAIEEGMTKASRTFVEKQIDQCIMCQLGVTLRKSGRSKASQIAEHPSAKDIQPQELTWQAGVKLFKYYKPAEMPAYDSHKSDSISVEFANFLKKLLTLSPNKPTICETELNDYLNGSIEVASALTEKVGKMIEAHFHEEDQESYALISYLLADHVVKNSEYKDALDHYKTAICFKPTDFDAWAGMALSWQSSLSQTLDDCDTSAQRCDPSVIRPIVRSFKMAHTIASNNGKLLMEFTSFALDIYSLLHRAERAKHKRRSSGNQSPVVDSESVVACFTDRPGSTERDLLAMIHDLSAQANASPDIDPPSERWFAMYMLGKIGNKLGEDIVSVITCFVQALEFLFENEAVFPGGRTIVSQNSPKLAVECFELFYRIHADILKFLAVQENDASQDEKIKQLSDLICRVYSRRLASFPTFTEFCSDKTSSSEPSASPSLQRNATDLASVCVHALVFCSTRFPEHFKSRYRLARAFFDHPLLANAVLCGNILVGWSVPEDFKGPFAGVKFGNPLFESRKLQQTGSTGTVSMMAGFWRSSHPDFDRRGAFFTHTEKCVLLLLDFLRSSDGNPEIWKLLNAAHLQLARPPTGGKRYFRDTDQSALALKALDYTVDKLVSSFPPETTCTREKLLEVYRLQQSVVRGGYVLLNKRLSDLLVGCFCSFQSANGSGLKSSDEDSQPTVGEAERFCQNMIMVEKQQKAKAEKAERASRRMSISAGAAANAVDPEVEAVMKSLVDNVVDGSNNTVLSE